MFITNLTVFVVSLIFLFLFSSVPVKTFKLSKSNVNYLPSLSSSDRHLSNIENSLSNEDDDDGYRSEILMADDELFSNRNRLPFNSIEANLRGFNKNHPDQFRKRATVSPYGRRADEDAFDSVRLSPSLKQLVETNPIARIWLTMLLNKVLKDESTPYIFKYGRRRK